MENIIQIVNHKDDLIALKQRSELNIATDIYRVSLLWVTNSSGEVLLAQRSLQKDNGPGLWGPAVAGTVEQGETYETNIYKEAEEEIGLIDHAFSSRQKLFVDHPRKYFVQMFSVVVDKPTSYFTIQEREVEQIKWVKIEELRKDVSNNPTKYTPSFPLIVDLLSA